MAKKGVTDAILTVRKKLTKVSHNLNQSREVNLRKDNDVSFMVFSQYTDFVPEGHSVNYELFSKLTLTNS